MQQMELSSGVEPIFVLVSAKVLHSIEIKQGLSCVEHEGWQLQFVCVCLRVPEVGRVSVLVCQRSIQFCVIPLHADICEAPFSWTCMEPHTVGAQDAIGPWGYTDLCTHLSSQLNA